MAQIVWVTPAGSLGVIPETKIYRNALVATDPDAGTVTYKVIAGTLPAGMQFSTTGLLTGTPYKVSENIVSRFTVRAAVGRKIADRTFSITVTGNNIPQWVTPAGSLGTFFESSYFSYQLEVEDADPGEPMIVRLASGQLPGGLTLTESGFISGYLQPAPDLNAIPGYSVTGIADKPYDFVFQTVDKNYEFTLEVTDGKTSNLRTFSIFVYSRKTLTADTTVITADETTVTADQTPDVGPFIVNNSPSDLGIFRTDNYFAYQFVGLDYNGNAIRYALTVNQGYGTPPGLELDPETGWYYGYILDQGATSVTYSFNIVPYQDGFIGDPIVCTGTVAGTNVIVCNSTAQIRTGQPIVFTGASVGGIIAAPNQIYYVNRVVNATSFSVSYSPNSGIPVQLVTTLGTMQANLVIAGSPTPYTLTLTGALNVEVNWLTDSDLGDIVNGSTSMLRIQAVNAGGRALSYRLKSGAYNLLPQGLELLPTGEISGRVSFDTFSLDQGATTFDETIQVTRNATVMGTTFDLTFTFTVNAWAPETTENIYKVRSVTVIAGGAGYSTVNLPALVFNEPIGATAIQAEVGAITVFGGAVVDVKVANPGSGYTLSNPAALTVAQGYGGFGAQFSVQMDLAGTRDVVSIDRTFTLRLIRKYDKPYQNLLIRAMPPQNDRVVLQQFLTNSEIFRPEWIYRYNDPFFGVARNVTYVHATGLLPKTLDEYVESLNLNHYRKELVLGQIKTAQARDSAGNVIYEVVYSEIVDNLVNNDGQSVGKIVNLPYSVSNGITTVTQVYPNSLYNMRDQVVNTVGLITSDVPLPLWMTSVQDNGYVLGFTPAWVIAYTEPGRSNEIAYYIANKFTGNLNQIDFEVDRYILDAVLSRNWDYTGEYISGHNPPPGPVGDLTVGPGIWTPSPPTVTTFDKYVTPPYNFIQNVDIATSLSFTDINGHTLADINALGGLDGILNQVNNSSLIFAQQQNWNPPPGNYLVWDPLLAYPQDCTVTYSIKYYIAVQDVPIGTDILNTEYWLEFDNTDAGWWIQTPFDPLVRTSPEYYPLMSQTPNGIPALWVNQIGYQINNVNYEQEPYQYTQTNIYEGSPDPLDGEPGSFDSTPYSLTTIVPGGDNINCTRTYAATDIIVCDDTGKLGVGEQIIFVAGIFGGIDSLTAVTDLYVGQNYYITDLGTTDWNVVTGLINQEFWVGQEITVAAQGTGTGVCRPIYFIQAIQGYNRFSVSRTLGGPRVQLTESTGNMVALAANQRMGIWKIHVDPISTIVTLTFERQTNPNEYVRIQRGTTYSRAELYYPTVPSPGQTRVAWAPIPIDLSTETTFDQNSLQFIEPVDMYDPGETNDKYLVFPKSNILV